MYILLKTSFTVTYIYNVILKYICRLLQRLSTPPTPHCIQHEKAIFCDVLKKKYFCIYKNDYSLDVIAALLFIFF